MKYLGKVINEKHICLIEWIANTKKFILHSDDENSLDEEYVSYEKQEIDDSNEFNNKNGLMIEEAILLCVLHDEIQNCEGTLNDYLDSEYLILQFSRKQIRLTIEKIVNQKEYLFPKYITDFMVGCNLIEKEYSSYIENVIEIMYEKYEYTEELDDARNFFFESRDRYEFDEFLIMAKSNDVLNEIISSFKTVLNELLSNGTACVTILQKYELIISRQNYDDSILSYLDVDIDECIENILAKLSVNSTFKKIICYGDLLQYSRFRNILTDKFNANGMYSNSIIFCDDRDDYVAKGLALNSAIECFDENVCLCLKNEVNGQSHVILVKYLDEEYSILTLDHNSKVDINEVTLTIKNTMAISVNIVIGIKDYIKQKIINEKNIYEINFKVPFFNYGDEIKIRTRLGFDNDLCLEITHEPTEETLVINSVYVLRG